MRRSFFVFVSPFFPPRCSSPPALSLSVLALFEQEIQNKARRISVKDERKRERDRSNKGFSSPAVLPPRQLSLFPQKNEQNELLSRSTQAGKLSPDEAFRKHRDLMKRQFYGREPPSGATGAF